MRGCRCGSFCYSHWVYLQGRILDHAFNPGLSKEEDCAERSSLGDILPIVTAESAEDIVMDKLEREELHSLIGECLDERENIVVTERFGIDGEKKTLAQLSESFGISRERIRQIELAALRKMRRKAKRLAG